MTTLLTTLLLVSLTYIAYLKGGWGKYKSIIPKVTTGDLEDLILSRRMTWNGVKRFLAYKKADGSWQGLANYEEIEKLNKRIQKLEQIFTTFLIDNLLGKIDKVTIKEKKTKQPKKPVAKKRKK